MSGTKEVKDGVFAIELVGVRKAFKEVVAVDTVDLTIRSGEFFPAGPFRVRKNDDPPDDRGSRNAHRG
jgi:hypothetical protein